MDDRVGYWINLSGYDYETAKSMLDTGRYLYVGFMCHQTIEKILKAFWQKTKGTVPPKTHNLLFLVTESGLKNSLSDSQLDFIDDLDPLNIAARYPEDISTLSNLLNRTECDLIYRQTGELLKWIKQML